MRRPTTIEQMKHALSRFTTDEGLEKALAFRPRPTDIFISPFAKCGTTWMQQIVHGLRSGGAMDFDEISGVVPWLELAHDMQIDPSAAQVAHPRAFKSHLSWDAIPKGGRYIVVLRDPVDAMVSFYRFFEGWVFEPGTITLEAFADFYLNRQPDKNYWVHLLSWWAVRTRDDVLLLTFEDMKTDLPGVVAQVADFIAYDISDDAREIATRQARFEFMKAHAGQFDDHLTRQFRDAACGLPPGGSVTKVDRGKAGQGAQIATPAIHAAFAQKWQTEITRRFGLPDYAALRAVLGGTGRG